MKIGNVTNNSKLELKSDTTSLNLDVYNYRDIWFKTSYLLDKNQSGEIKAKERFQNFKTHSLNFNFPKNFNGKINLKNLNKVKAAVIREKGSNSEREMAYAMSLAGFEVKDVHMTDLISGRENLEDINFIVAVGGFSNSDVLGSAKGWAGSFLYNEKAKNSLMNFYKRENTLSLGVCNGCQMVSKLKDIIPGAESWPSFEKNLSDQFEARLAQVKIQKSDSILLRGMEGWSMPIASAHGEGHAKFSQDNLDHLISNNQIALNFVDSNENNTETYPLNPNGSAEGVTGITAADGRVTIMMPHPERVFRKLQMSWRPEHWKEFSPWMQIFINARKSLN